MGRLCVKSEVGGEEGNPPFVPVCAQLDSQIGEALIFRYCNPSAWEFGGTF
jgi:hypothetical protein